MNDHESKPSSCPRCGSTHVVPIVYGLPSPELAEEAERGEVTLGGCVISDDDPEWCCQQCGHRWS